MYETILTRIKEWQEAYAKTPLYLRRQDDAIKDQMFTFILQQCEIEKDSRLKHLWIDSVADKFERVSGIHAAKRSIESLLEYWQTSIEKYGDANSRKTQDIQVFRLALIQFDILQAEMQLQRAT